MHEREKKQKYIRQVGWHTFSRSLSTTLGNLVTRVFLRDGVKLVQTVDFTPVKALVQ